MPIDLEHLRATCADPLPHPSPAELHAATHTLTTWAVQHFTTLPQQSVGASAPASRLQELLHHPAPEAGRGIDAVFHEWQTHIVPFTYPCNHPKFLAFVPGAPSFASILGDWLTAATNYFAGVWLEASGPSQVETTVLDWFRTWLGLPATTKGVLTSGGSEANLTALVVAREQVPWTERAKMVLYVAAERHWSIDRACMVMGLPRSQIRPVPVDENFRLRGATLAEYVRTDRAAGLRPWAVVANAGATNTGTIDALQEVAVVARTEQLWFHVDAAYGWPGIFTDEADAIAGIAAADSVTLDPHKWFAQTFEAGGVLIRDGHLLPATFANRPDYMLDVVPNADEINYADHGIALTRRFRALKIWFSVQVLGLDWFRQLARHGCALARYAEARLSANGFTILCPARLGVVCFRYEPRQPAHAEAINAAIVERLRQTGDVFLSSTRLRGQYAPRMCFVNWRTTAADVDDVVQWLTNTGRELDR